MNKLFTRGYSVWRERLKRSAKFSRSCFNCDYYYQASGDKKEVCQNNTVTEFDIVSVDNNIYCSYWTPSKAKNDNKFKKLGRDRLD